MATEAAAMLGMIIGAYNGFIRPFVAYEIAPLVISMKPPIPVPMPTPTR